MDLRVLRVALVVHPAHRDPAGGELILVQVGPGAGPAHVLIGAGSLAERGEAKRLVALRLVVRRPGDLRVDPQQRTEPLEEQAVDVAQALELGRLLVEHGDLLGHRVEVRGSRVGLTKCLPVALGPARLGDADLVDPLLVAALDLDGDRQPQEPLRGLHAVSVAPVALGVLPLVEQDEPVDEPDDVEVAPPRHVARLDRSDALHASGPSPATWRSGRVPTRVRAGREPPGVSTTKGGRSRPCSKPRRMKRRVIPGETMMTPPMIRVKIARLANPGSSEPVSLA